MASLLLTRPTSHVPHSHPHTSLSPATLIPFDPAIHSLHLPTSLPALPLTPPTSTSSTRSDAPHSPLCFLPPELHLLILSHLTLDSLRTFEAASSQTRDLVLSIPFYRFLVSDPVLTRLYAAILETGVAEAYTLDELSTLLQDRECGTPGCPGQGTILLLAAKSRCCEWCFETTALLNFFPTSLARRNSSAQSKNSNADRAGIATVVAAPYICEKYGVTMETLKEKRIPLLKPLRGTYSPTTGNASLSRTFALETESEVPLVSLALAEEVFGHLENPTSQAAPPHPALALLPAFPTPTSSHGFYSTLHPQPKTSTPHEAASILSFLSPSLARMSAVVIPWLSWSPRQGWKTVEMWVCARCGVKRGDRVRRRWTVLKGRGKGMEEIVGEGLRVWVGEEGRGHVLDCGRIEEDHDAAGRGSGSGSKFAGGRNW